MREIYTSIILLFLICTWCEGQITFQKTYEGDNCRSLDQTSDGGYVMSGYASSFGASVDIYLLKTDSIGDIVWTKTFGGFDVDFSTEVRQTTDGGYIIVGSSRSFFGGDLDIYLIKTNSNGNLAWSKIFDGSGNEEGNSVQQTSDGGYIITGYANGYGAGSADVYLLKTDSAGGFLWSKTFGGIGDDRGNSVKQTTDEGYVIAGVTQSFGAGDEDVYLIKTDSAGDTLWTKTFGGAMSESGLSVQQTTDGGYAIGGFTSSFGAGNSDIYMIKTDTMGSLIWSITLGGTGLDGMGSHQQTTDRGYIIGGATTRFGGTDTDACLNKIDSNGNLTWSKSFGDIGNDIGLSVQQSNDGGYTLAGTTTSFPLNVLNLYLIKTDSSGSSGCFENNLATNLTTPLTITNATTTITTSVSVLSKNAATTTGNGGIETSLCSSVYAPNIQTPRSQIELSPNPANFLFTIDSKQNPIKEIEIFNLLGEKIYSASVNRESCIVNCESFPPGLYFVSITNDLGEQATSKVVIIK